MKWGTIETIWVQLSLVCVVRGVREMNSEIQELVKQTKEIRILYVEDERDVREQTMMMLGVLFDHVDVAFDGEDAWQKYQSGSYDIVFTDISMPRMDGLELSRNIKQSDPFQKIIIISAYNTADYLLEAIEIGVDGFVLKPIKLDKIVLTIKRLVDSILSKRIMQAYRENLEKEIIEKTRIIQEQALSDTLTGLQNRFALNRRLDSIKEPHILIIINIDNFDSINTVYGYENGNFVISSLANILSTNMLDKASLYYLGRDEFGILCDGSYERDVIERYAKELQAIIHQSVITLNGNSLKGTVTIAIAKGEKNLFQQAHMALKEAKKEGRNRIKFYDQNLKIEKLQSKIQEFSPIVREAIDSDSIVPYFQPIVDNKTKKINKYECLARIVSNNEIYSPYYFIDIAEMIGMLPNITRVMIDKAFQKFQHNEYSFSINITEIDLNDNYLRDYLKEKVQEYKINPSRVILEVLEGISATGVDASLKQLKSLQELGFSIAIDDFGTQNSNFERVNAMQVDFIKIDGAFVKNIATDEKSYSIVKTITEFSKSIGAEVIAEFVHSQEVQNLVEKLDIEYSQGYLFSEPKPELVG